MLLLNQVGFKPVSLATLDRLLGVHRSTRIRCLAELKELGFISGSATHIVIEDPELILGRLNKEAKKAKQEAQEIIDDYGPIEEKPKEVKQPEKVDYLQKASDAWNLYRPKNYQKIRRISAQLVKAVDLHMRELNVDPYEYEEFFSVLKAGIEKSDFWSNKNSNKTLQAVTGIGLPTDKKKKNVYELFNDGLEAPAMPTEEEERSDTIVYPNEYRKVIDEYDAAQFVYNEAYRSRRVTPEIDQYVIRTENALKEIGLDPARFRMKYGMATWPTDTPEPAESRVVDWLYEDEVAHGYR